MIFEPNADTSSRIFIAVGAARAVCKHVHVTVLVHDKIHFADLRNHKSANESRKFVPLIYRSYVNLAVSVVCERVISYFDILLVSNLFRGSYEFCISVRYDFSPFTCLLRRSTGIATR